ncbi:MAG: hypothetical protein P8Z70_03155 [Desulfuromonadales bacterium]|jgi:hypothetical protein
MKTRANLTVVVLTLWGLVPAAIAAPAGREDNSSLVVWVFLGFCALLVVAQLLPAIRNARLTARQERERRATEEALKVEVEK